MAELAKVRLLPPEEERALWERYKTKGDEQARRLFIESYQPLVFKCAKPFAGQEAIMDIVQEGTVGLIEAVEHYEPAKGVAFSLFAVHRVKGRMYNYLRKEGRSDIACLDADEKATNELLDDAPPVSEQVEDKELIARLYESMGRLPQKERLVLENVCLQSRAVEEVANLLHVSASQIYRLRQTGIRRVRGMLSRFMQHWR